jgi:hypothetical protein
VTITAAAGAAGLKGVIPAANFNGCCTSGVPMRWIEPSIDRPEPLCQARRSGTRRTMLAEVYRSERHHQQLLHVRRSLQRSEVSSSRPKSTADQNCQFAGIQA